MTKGKKILLILGILGVAIGGFAIAKFLTRNTVRYKFLTVQYVDIPKSELTTSEADN